MSKTTFGLPKKREQVINLLQQAYIEQNLEEEDYELRLNKAMAADSLETLQEVVADFPNAPRLLPQKGQALPTEHKGEQRLAPIEGEVKRSSALFSKKQMEIRNEIVAPLQISAFFGEHHLNLQQASVEGDRLYVSVETIFGKNVIDLRGERLADKHIEINVTNFFGETRILLPKGVQVDNEVNVIMGEVSHSHRKAEKWFKKLIGIKPPAETNAIPFKLTLYGSCTMGEVKLVHD